MQTDLDALIEEQKNIAGSPINLVKVKRDGCVKEKFCVDEQPQIECESQTVVNTFLMLLALIASKETCHIVTVGVAGTYLNAEMDYFLLMKFKERALEVRSPLDEDRRGKFRSAMVLLK